MLRIWILSNNCSTSYSRTDAQDTDERRKLLLEFIGDEEDTRRFRKLLLFSGNYYLGLSSHPTIGNAAAKAAQEHGMGPRGSSLICGYTDYHRRLESSLADLKKK